MTGKCKKINIAFLHIHRNRPGTLRRIYGKKQMMSPADFPNLPNRKDGSADIGRMEHDNCFRIAPYRFLYRLRMHRPILLCPHSIVSHALGFHLFEGTHDGIVLQPRHQHMISRL